MFPSLIRRLADKPMPTRISSSIRNTQIPNNSRYKLKKVWPPDFSKLTEKEQFRFERRYKRRIELATARPRWDKFVRLAQLFSVTSVIIYSVLFMDIRTESPRLQGLREKLWGSIGIGSFSSDQRHERRKPDTQVTTTTTTDQR